MFSGNLIKLVLLIVLVADCFWSEQYHSKYNTNIPNNPAQFCNHGFILYFTNSLFCFSRPGTVETIWTIYILLKTFAVSSKLQMAP